VRSHLGEQRQQYHRQLGHRATGVGGVDPDRVGQVAHPDSALGQLVDQVQRVAHGATEPVQGVHHDHIPAAGIVEQCAQSEAVGGRPGVLVDVDPRGRDALLARRVQVTLKVLF
jgi:hypothetical protein